MNVCSIQIYMYIYNGIDLYHTIYKLVNKLLNEDHEV